MADRHADSRINNSSMNFVRQNLDDYANTDNDNQPHMYVVDEQATLVNVENFSPDNIRVGGVNDQNNSGARPEVGNYRNTNFPDIYNIVLQNQMIMQDLLTRQFPVMNTADKTVGRQSLPTATVSKPPTADRSKPPPKKRRKIDDSCLTETHETQLDALFAPRQTEITLSESDENESDNESRHDSDSENDSDGVSDDNEYSDNDVSDKNNNTEKIDDQEKQDNINVLELMKDFIESEDKSGPKINSALADLVNSGLRKKSNEKKTKDLSQVYARPENVTSLKVPRVNPGVWKQISRQNKDADVKLQRVQNLLAKAFCPLLYLLDIFVDATEKNKVLSRNKVVNCSKLCKDAYQLMQITYTDITYRRRGFLKPDIKHKYKDLCNDDTPVTDMLFGDNVKETLSKLDAEFNMGNKVGKRSDGGRGFPKTGNKGFGFRPGYHKDKKSGHGGGSNKSFKQDKGRKDKNISFLEKGLHKKKNPKRFSQDQ